MVKTIKGDEVCRLSIVDGINKNVVYDEYILPQHPIVDYVTEYSGITPEILSNCKNSIF